MKLLLSGKYLGKDERRGGPPAVLSYLADEFSHIDTIQTSILELPSPNRLVKKPAMLNSIELSPLKQILTLFFPLIRLLLSGRYDIINAHGFSILNAMIVILKRLHKIPVVASVHGLVVDEKAMGSKGFSPLGLFLEKIILRRADFIITVSELFKERLKQTYGLPDSKIYVIHNGITADVFRTSDSKVFRNKFGIANKYIVLFVGRILFIKGVDLLVDSINKLKINCKLVLVGVPTRFLERLRVQHHDVFSSGRIVVTGRLSSEDLSSAYSACSIFVLPSRQDSFPLVVLEAMAKGKPVVISNQVGAKEVIVDGVHGFVVPPKVTLISRRLEYLLKNPKKAAVMGKLAKERAVEFLWEKVAGKYLQVYYEIMGLLGYGWRGLRRSITQNCAE